MSSRMSDCFLPFLETRILYVALDTRLALKLQRYACFCLQGDGIKLSTHSRVLIGMNFSVKNFVCLLFELITTLSSFLTLTHQSFPPVSGFMHITCIRALSILLDGWIGDREMNCINCSEIQTLTSIRSPLFSSVGKASALRSGTLWKKCISNYEQDRTVPFSWAPRSWKALFWYFPHSPWGLFSRDSMSRTAWLTPLCR